MKDLSKLSRGQGQGVETAAVPPPAPPDGSWTPLATHQNALSAICEDPNLAASKGLLARTIGLDSSTVRRWFRDPGFVEWWNRSLLEIARASLGPMVVELRRLVFSPNVSAGDKVRAVESVVRIVGQPERSFGAAVVAILERWSGRGSIKIAARGEAVAMELSEIGETPPPSGRTGHDVELDGEGGSTPPLDGEDLDPSVIAEAVQSSPLTIERAARAAVGMMTAPASKGRGVRSPSPAKRELPVQWEPGLEVDLSDPVPPPPVIQGEGGSESRNRPPEVEGPRTYDIPPPDRSGDSTRFDFTGRAFVPRGEGSKPAPFEPEVEDVFE